VEIEVLPDDKRLLLKPVTRIPEVDVSIDSDSELLLLRMQLMWLVRECFCTSLCCEAAKALQEKLLFPSNKIRIDSDCNLPQRPSGR
jgi:hypothetical protein